jgi:hypothetical protein
VLMCSSATALHALKKARLQPAIPPRCSDWAA